MDYRGKIVIAASIYVLVMAVASLLIARAINKDVLPEDQLREHCSDFKRVLDYYREGILTTDQALEILLWEKSQNSGVFVRLADTNPHIDKFFVEPEAYKRSREYQKLLEK